MYITIKNIFRLVLVIGCGWGIALLLGLFEGRFEVGQLVFYTVLSNLLIFFAYLFLVIKSLIDSVSLKRAWSADFSPNVMGALTLMIVITGLIYNFVLVPTIPDTAEYAVNNLSDILVHTFTPIMVFVDWVLFANTSDTKKIKPWTWAILPLIYWLFTIIRAQIGGPIMGFGSYYPYFFIDADQLGWGRVILNVLILVVVFILFGYLMKLIAWVTNGFKPFTKRNLL
ncbi:Pr6Pr family membrane protein [Enterococcus sp. 669A]|uniref:Pr6Pr family membrane protein n=1 Tax=Candidatus Enterococcus moelleringii TaxID=2815325 RepID=A0ABS3LDD5_9ENTE|nr:Pr6Pr family membrane protein [Enterococcus sp. 669A]MBO1307647.1 Pr6Pr family membrane protein [Enterococcus sp. 669A]